jgi:P-type Ca2+ transporter type 2C
MRRAPTWAAAHASAGTDAPQVALTMSGVPEPALDLGGLTGLGEPEARRRLEQQGPNELPVQAFTFAVHVPIAGLSILPVFFADWPLLLLPTHIVFLELIIDPSCSLVFEAEAAEADVMKRPPRGRKDRLFSLATVGSAVLQGVSVLAVCLGVFLFAHRNHAPEAARALTFVTLVAAILVVLLANRSSSLTIIEGLRARNSALWLVMGGTVGLLTLVLVFSSTRRIFHFAPIHAGDLLLSIAAGLACTLWFEALKLGKRWTKASLSPSK